MNVTKNDLIQFFTAGIKPSSDWRIGTEYEKFLNTVATGLPMPYEGSPGIRDVLLFLQQEHGWSPVFEEEHLIALKRNNASITLEPGGQFELSGAPFKTIHETALELDGHTLELAALKSRYPIEDLWCGFHPRARLDDVEWMPKGRYGIMRNYLPSRGSLATSMMKRTCTVQANLDYGSEADAGRKLRVASVLSPLVTAMFATSRLVEGKDSGKASFRQHVWSDVDPDRCGTLVCAFAGDDGDVFARYTEWALNVPMFFVYKGGTYHPAEGMTFAEFMSHGFHGKEAMIEDWELHLSTVFPDVRLKQWIEVRSADCVPPALICALPAFWKGVFHRDEALSQIEDLLGSPGAEEVRSWTEDAAHNGLSGKLTGRSIRNLALDAVDIADKSLQIQAELNVEGRDESTYLAPLLARLRE